ncbi:MAG TPA: hypothetical protein VHG93_00350, partial [Longimicrobium sp.]|nr:hypothetical protein [Longimicrobium sp.]
MHRVLVAVRPLALLRAALACALLTISVPAAAHAQCQTLPDGTYWCDDGSGPGTDVDNTPYIAVSPADLKTTQPNLTVTVTGSDDRGIQPGSLHIYAGNQEVTSQFSYTETVSSSGPVRVRFTATGNVRLLETGPTTVYATVCDNASVPQCTSSNTVTYTLSLPGVSVSPHGSVILDVAAASYSRNFTVTNRGTSAATFSLTAECRYASTRNPITPCAPSMSSVSLGPQASQAVAVSFPFTAVDSVLNVRLVARQSGESGVQDVGWIDISPIGSGGGQAAPTVRIAELSNDATGLVDRSQCLTVGAGAGAAYECGDLRLVHALPATSTRGKTRAPVLHYSSALAQPRPTVYADVTIPASASAPGSVVATVTLANGVVHTRTFRGSDFYPGSTRRIGVQWDGTGMTAWSVYDYTLQVTAVYGTAQYPAPPVAGKVTVLTRATSPYGAGWWIAGQERLMCVDCGNGGSMMVVGGDGSTRLYNQIWPYDGLTWASAEPDGPPDTLRLSFPATGSQWTRKLRGGGEVHYDGHGRHWRTISRLGDTTLFTFVPNSVALASIVLPRRDGGTPQSYVFGYDASGRLSTITAPANGGTTRQVTLTYGLGDRRITAIRDPDTISVQFVYGDAAAPRVVTARTDRRRTTVRYGYDAAGKLATVKVPLAAGDTITSTFRSAEGLGVATTTAQAVSVPRMYAYTRLDGPRTDADDATYFWLDRWGSPSRIRDALGAETWIIRGDSRFRALPTTLVAPSGLTTTAVYDGRGRVSTSTVHNPLGDGQNAVTTYTYDDVCDAPKTISAPLVGTVTVEYDPATCNVLWQQQGDAVRRVNFRYYASGGAVGLLRAVQAPLDAAG